MASICGMTIEEIRKNAPEGSVYYCDLKSNIAYFNKRHNVWNGFNFVLDTCFYRERKPL